MKVVIQMTKPEQVKALEVLHRGPVPFSVLRGGIYIVDEESASELGRAGVQFTTLTHESSPPILQGVVVERV